MKYEVVGSLSAVMAEGEESSSGSGDSSQDDPAPIPHVDFPQLHFAEGGASPDNFIPTCLSNFTDTLGSMGPFCGGAIWAHTVTVGWVSEQSCPGKSSPARGHSSFCCPGTLIIRRGPVLSLGRS